VNFESFVLAASTADLAAEPRAREHADAVEFRMDLAVDPLDALSGYDGALPLLVTNRVAGEGGEAPEDPTRLDALRAAVEVDAVEAVDLELGAVENGAAEGVREAAVEHGASVVVSAHDFETTPEPEAIRDLLQRGAEAGDVAKLAVTADSRGDVLDLLRVTHDCAADGLPVATMAMGEVGRHSRAVAPLYGSRIGYAPVDPAEATAPGQYDLSTLARLVAELGGA
jgi:3-dehydroquinate dehydratase-1